MIKKRVNCNDGALYINFLNNEQFFLKITLSLTNNNDNVIFEFSAIFLNFQNNNIVIVEELYSVS